MKELGSCVGPISGEHIISKSVILVLRADGDFSISGLPWLEAGEEKILAPNNLEANCLCVKHNSALSPLDAAAKYFVASLKLYLETNAGLRHALVSGHDIERWLLKTAKAVAVSKNFARGNILGFSFVLLLERADVGRYPFLRDAKYRPGRIAVVHPSSSTNWVTLSWEDSKRHDTLTAQFVQPVRQQT